MSARDAWINFKTVNNLDETTHRHRGLLETKPTPGEHQSHITQVRRSRDEIQQTLQTITHDPDPLWVNEISAKSYSATLTELVRKANQCLSESSWGVSPSPQDLSVLTSTTEFESLVTTQQRKTPTAPASEDGVPLQQQALHQEQNRHQ
jgi:hypothetical protein